MRKFLLENNTPIIYDYYKDFVHFVCDALGIDHDIPINLISKTGTASFGNYHPGSRVINIAIEGRHTADILRTLAHELVHELQHSNGDHEEHVDRLEYEANAVAGMLMRDYNKLHPELYDAEVEPDPEELDDMLGVGAAQGSLENAGITGDAFQTPSYEGLSDAQPMRPPYPVELAESNMIIEDAPVNAAGSGAVAGIGVGPQGEPGVLPRKKRTPMFKRKTFSQFRKTT